MKAENTSTFKLDLATLLDVEALVGSEQIVAAGP